MSPVTEHSEKQFHIQLLNETLKSMIKPIPRTNERLSYWRYRVSLQDVVCNCKDGRLMF